MDSAEGGDAETRRQPRQRCDANLATPGGGESQHGTHSRCLDMQLTVTQVLGFFCSGRDPGGDLNLDRCKEGHVRRPQVDKHLCTKAASKALAKET